MKTFLKLLLTAAVLAGVGNGVNCAMAQEKPRQAPGASGGEHSKGPTANALFFFPGGTPRDFLAAAEKQFHADWLSAATIPAEMEGIRVPKMRFSTSEPPQSVLDLYNRLGEANPALGKWHWEGPAEAPMALMLVPSTNAKDAVTQKLPEPDAELKVFQLKYISGTNLTVLAQAITVADEAGQHAARNGHKPLAARIVIDERTSSLIVSATPESMSTIEALVQTLDVPGMSPQTLKDAVKAPAGQPTSNPKK